MLRRYYNIDVVFCYPYMGSIRDQEYGHRYLERGKKYTANQILEDNGKYTIHISDFPDVFFDGVLFEILFAKK